MSSADFLQHPTKAGLHGYSMNVSNRPLSIVQAYIGRPEATMRMYIEMDEGGGPRFWTSGALYPLGIAVDHPSITGHPEVFGLSSDIVPLVHSPVSSSFILNHLVLTFVKQNRACHMLCAAASWCRICDPRRSTLAG